MTIISTFRPDKQLQDAPHPSYDSPSTCRRVALGDFEPDPHPQPTTTFLIIEHGISNENKCMLHSSSAIWYYPMSPMFGGNINTIRSNLGQPFYSIISYLLAQTNPFFYFSFVVSTLSLPNITPRTIEKEHAIFQRQPNTLRPPLIEEFTGGR